MCDQDERDKEADYYIAMSKGQFHEVELDVVIRVRVQVPGATHEPGDIDEDFVSEQALQNGDIINVEEV